MRRKQNLDYILHIHAVAVLFLPLILANFEEISLCHSFLMSSMMKYSFTWLRSIKNYSFDLTLNLHIIVIACGIWIFIFSVLYRFQGFKWYARRLRIDEEGDVADEFLDEVLPEVKTVSMTEDNRHRSLPTFEVKYSTLPAKVKSQVLTQGRIQHSVEHQGRLLWV